MLHDSSLALVTLVVLLQMGCGSSTPAPAPIEKKINEQASKPLEWSQEVTGTMLIDGVAPDASKPMVFKKGQVIRITVDAKLANPAYDKTAAVVLCRQPKIIDGVERHLVGANWACNIPVADLDFTLPIHPGNWNLLVLTSKHELVCETSIVIE